MDPQEHPVDTIKMIAFLWASRNDLTDEEWGERQVDSQTSQVLRMQGPLGQEMMVSALRTLTPEQARDVAWWTLQHDDLRPDGYYWSGLLGAIANYVDGGLVPLYPDILERKIYYPASIFRGADPATRDELIAGIEHVTPEVLAENSGVRNDLLLCLAWVGDEAVQQLFARWREKPPAWSDELFVAPEDYANQGGWELTPEGTRRDLFLAPAYELMLAELEAEGAQAGPVVVPGPAQAVGASCAWCGRELNALFDLDLRDSRLAFLGLKGTRVRVTYCPFCSLFATLYTDVDTRGSVTWSASNEKPDYLDAILREEPPPASASIEHALVLGVERRTPAETVGGWGTESQLGGLPNWIQDAEYPVCPGCARRMPCIGQVKMEDVVSDRSVEGITYAFLCVECGKAATTYQQT